MRRLRVVAGAGAWGTVPSVYERYAQTLRFHVDACPPRSPEAKGKVERRIRDVRAGCNPYRRHWNALEELHLRLGPGQGDADDIRAIDWSDAPWHETVDEGHGCIERRRCSAVHLSGAEWDASANLHGRRQAVRIARERETLKTGTRSVEVTYTLTSLGADRAGLQELLALVRNHWRIENRLHYLRDFTYDEHRCRDWVRHLPRNLACLTNAAIAIVRCKGRFRYLPEANRHYAARAHDALDTILSTPNA